MCFRAGSTSSLLPSLLPRAAKNHLFSLTHLSFLEAQLPYLSAKQTHPPRAIFYVLSLAESLPILEGVLVLVVDYGGRRRRTWLKEEISVFGSGPFLPLSRGVLNKLPG